MKKPKEEPKKKIVFDLGAVLFSWRPRELLMRELPHIAVDVSSAAHWEAQIFQSYGGDWGEFDRGTVTPLELVQRIVLRTGLSAPDVVTVVEAVPRELQPIPATVALLNRLADAGHTLFYLSNMPEPYAQQLESRNAFFRRFSGGVFSCRVHHNKPEPQIFEIAAQRFGVAPDELVFLDDHAPNVLAAQALGWNALQFRDATQALTDLRRAGWVKV
jgi:putative hydrolase of the HAD superfamily